MEKRIGIALDIGGGAQTFALAINLWTKIWQEPFGIRTLTLNRLVGAPTSNMFATRERVIIQDYEGDCYTIRWATKGQVRIEGWISGEVFLGLSKDFTPSLFWKDLKSDPLLT